MILVEKIGQKIFIDNFPIIGKRIKVTSLPTVFTLGGTNDKFFYLRFKNSWDGVNFSENWREINELVGVESENVYNSIFLFIKFELTRSGTENTTPLYFKNLNFGVEFDEIEDRKEYTQKVLELVFNFVDKAYNEGIVPTFVERKNTLRGDKDFLDLLFPMMFLKAKSIIDISEKTVIQNDYEQLKKYLQNTLSFFLKKEMSMFDLHYILKNQKEELKSRGTINVLLYKGFLRYDSFGSIKEIKQVDGEILRILDKKENDEFAFLFRKFDNSGFSVNRYSPLFRGLKCNEMLNKSYSNSYYYRNANHAETKNYVDSSEYSLLGNLNNFVFKSSNSLIPNTNSYPTTFKGSVNTIVGIGSVNHLPKTSLIKVNPYLNYRLSFSCMQYAETSDSITVRMKGYDNFGRQVNFQDVRNNTSQDYFFSRKRLPRPDEYFKMNLIIHSCDTQLKPKSRTILGGTNLKFQKAISYVTFEILNDCTSGNNVVDLMISNVEFSINDSKNYSFLNTKNLFSLWAIQNSQLSEEKINKEISEKLIPYNTILFREKLQKHGNFNAKKFFEPFPPSETNKQNFINLKVFDCLNPYANNGVSVFLPQNKYFQDIAACDFDSPSIPAFENINDFYPVFLYKNQDKVKYAYLNDNIRVYCYVRDIANLASIVVSVYKKNQIFDNNGKRKAVIGAPYFISTDFSGNVTSGLNIQYNGETVSYDLDLKYKDDGEYFLRFSAEYNGSAQNSQTERYFSLRLEYDGLDRSFIQYKEGWGDIKETSNKNLAIGADQTIFSILRVVAEDTEVKESVEFVFNDGEGKLIPVISTQDKVYNFVFDKDKTIEFESLRRYKYSNINKKLLFEGNYAFTNPKNLDL